MDSIVAAFSFISLLVSIVPVRTEVAGPTLVDDVVTVFLDFVRMC